MASNEHKEDRRFHSVAESIERGMVLAGMGRKQFALFMQVSPSTVTQWLSGHHNFTIETIFRIQDALGIQIIPLSVHQVPPHFVSIWEYKGNRYIVLRMAELKFGTIWIPCVVYESIHEKKTYVREREDFREKFAPFKAP